jgi:hypothetical protein
LLLPAARAAPKPPEWLVQLLSVLKNCFHVLVLEEALLRHTKTRMCVNA